MSLTIKYPTPKEKQDLILHAQFGAKICFIMGLHAVCSQSANIPIADQDYSSIVFATKIALGGVFICTAIAGLLQYAPTR